MNNVLFLVGQHFVAPAMPDNVLGLSGFVSSLRQGGRAADGEPCELHLGQGISAYDARYLREELQRRGLSRRYLVRGDEAHKASRALVHKHLEKNVLIGDLSALGECRFRARLRVDDDNELLLDHASGWHVPGMVILEAMRQMAMASVVASGMLESLGPDCGFMIQSWNTRFLSFLVPLDSQLECSLLPLGAPRGRRLEFRGDIAVTQCERVSAEASLEFAALEKRALESVEERHARSALRQFPQPAAAD